MLEDGYADSYGSGESDRKEELFGMHILECSLIVTCPGPTLTDRIVDAIHRDSDASN